MSTAKQLAYLGFEVRDVEQWEVFATTVLGLTVDRRFADGTRTLRMDHRETRFVLRPGAADDLFAVGWEVGGASDLEAIQARLQEQGVRATPLTEAECALRSVEQGLAFRDPSGVPNEVICSPKSHPDDFESPLVPAGFVTGTQGLGHIVLRCKDKAESVAFYRAVLGLQLSDRIICSYFGLSVDIDFFHTQEPTGGARHHSLALSEPIEGVPAPHQVFHFMIEARDQDAVGAAYDRAIAAGVPLAQTLGRHPNDNMFSFYALTPSGFQFEFGWGGRIVDAASWEPSTYDRLSIWGHHPPAALAPRRKRGNS